MEAVDERIISLEDQRSTRIWYENRPTLNKGFLDIHYSPEAKGLRDQNLNSTIQLPKRSYVHLASLDGMVI